MLRASLRLVCCAGLLLTGAFWVHAGPADDQKIENILKVKVALSKGCQAIKCGQFQEAVNGLEAHLALIGDNREYLTALRDAYRGLIRELQQTTPNSAAITGYQSRLNTIELGLAPETKGTPAPQPTGTPEPARPASAPAPAAAQPAPTTAAPSPAPAIEQGVDPFSDANSVQFQQASALMDQAHRAFNNKGYADASRLYEQAFRLNPAMDAPFKERWAYCKLHVVATSLNRPEPAVPSQEMEREIRLALSLAPRKFDDFGNTLLRRIQDKPTGQVGAGGGPGGLAEAQAGLRPAEGGAVQVRHVPGQEKGWTVCETTNFRIFHKQSAEQAERVARAAEAAREMSARKWFGEIPATWSPRCDLYLHLTKQDYSQETRQPPDCPGHSSMGMEGDRVWSRRIDLRCDDPNMTYGVLPHEITHVVLAGRFGDQHIPRWADEGMAVLSEPRDRVERHLRNLPRHQRERQLFAIADLMKFKEYPEGKYIDPFYAQSVSLVDFLCQQKGGTQVFARFLRDGLRIGYEPALNQYYGIKSFGDLQGRWQAATLNGAAGFADRGK